MTTIELKKYIYENQKIEDVLLNIGCGNIRYHADKDYYSCSNFNGDNPTAINVKNNEYLNVVNWTRQQEFGECSDIITLVQYNRQYSFIDAVKYLHNILGLEYKWNKTSQIQKEKKEEDDPLYVFKKWQNKKKRVDVADIEVLDEEILDEYTPLLHIDWVRQGITERARKKFNICYSYNKKRIIIPIRHWLTKELVGLNMRSTIANCEELGIPKYLISSTYQKSWNLFGLSENYDDIQRAGYVVVAESEKSCMKRSSLYDDTVVALSGKFMSDEQAAILIGLNVEVVLALDKDVDINEVRHMAERFYRIRPVSYIWDKWGILEDKQAPMDANNKVYQFLFKHRVRYDENEHLLYLKSLEKK